eukprot:TRINITY_DN58384_c0_g1_i1.p1 TRINITY_DN58384_c0_g1~~TRINITY_DN58384_c0_g1_i1.p1  ORF type:complete len:903 (+),score=83.43 TRINITY_DN58384_c0_g1_i1:131-2839(+)
MTDQVMNDEVVSPNSRSSRTYTTAGGASLLLMHFIGPDKVGTCTFLMKSIGGHLGVEILDITQLVIYDQMYLGCLMHIKGDSAEVLKDALFAAHQVGIRVEAVPITSEAYAEWRAEAGKPRYIMPVLARRITSKALCKVLSTVQSQGLRLSLSRRVSRHQSAYDSFSGGSKACLEFQFRGTPKEEMKIREMLLQSGADGVDIAWLKDDLFRHTMRLVAFDMDSTLIQAEVINELAKEAGVGDKVAAVTERAMQGELDFTASLRERVACLAGLSESVLQKVAKRLPVTEGMPRLVSTLRRAGFKLAILSGGFSYFSDYLKNKFGFDYAFSNTLEIIDGKITGKVLGRIVDGKEKAILLQEIAEKEGIDLNQTVAIGDGANDLWMLGKAGMGIAFHAKPVVRAKAKHQLSTLGLDAVLYMLGLSDVVVDAPEAEDSQSDASQPVTPVSPRKSITPAQSDENLEEEDLTPRKGDLFMMYFSGDDASVQGDIQEALAPHNVEIIDIQQTVTHRKWMCGILLKLGKEGSGALKEALLKAHQLNLQVTMSSMNAEEYEEWVLQQRQVRFVLRVVTPRLTPALTEKISGALSAHGVNIESVQRLSGRKTLGELEVPIGDQPVTVRTCLNMELAGAPTDPEKLRQELAGISKSKEFPVDIALLRDDLFCRTLRIAAFDLNKTIIKSDIVTHLAAAAKKKQQLAEAEQRIAEMAIKRGEIDFAKTLPKRVSVFEGVPESVLEETYQKLQMMEGVESLLKVLKSLKLKTVLVSKSGFGFFVRKFQERLGFDFAVSNELEVVDGVLTGRVTGPDGGPVLDAKGKLAKLGEIAETEGFTMAQCIAIGGELPMTAQGLGAGVFGVAFNQDDDDDDDEAPSGTSLRLNTIPFLLGMSDHIINLGTQAQAQSPTSAQ